ncbi:PBP1A family penicillin-binding protein [Ornithinibacillus sp. L9]|uniref:PBP1A family penicillin-binding protein n=1 Tax=Ornithinibacillus caprae TaxID=2678566 RepID=A0A6N8FMJ1_9BACI|nr:PBP1A family penicillin-binding protein [Ornithinibacillus caprae]MUK89614.1 PBP1A family penicillin-binding protein [Ornithinibacillus caprae]
MGKSFLSKKVSALLVKLALSIVAIGIIFVAGIYVVAYLMGPPNLTNEQNTIYYSDSGDVIGEEHGLENRYWVGLEKIPAELIDATLLTEDQRFFKHHGFDIKRIFGAIISDIKTFSLKEGASTLTQQYARNLFLSHEKTWNRKLKEAFYAIRLELFYSKEEILEGYLNTVYYGHGAYGIETASKYFFNKSADSLTLAEIAMLVGVPKGPTYYSPLNDEERATNRQQQILSAMFHENIISEEEYYLAKRENLEYTKTRLANQNNIGPYFQDTVLNEAANLLQIDMESIRSGGYQIHTTLHIDAQQALEESIATAIPDSSDIEVGSLAIDPTTGAIRAMVGGRDYEKSPFNRTIQARRMPGSTFKPFLYYAALQHGYTASTMLMSKPTAFELEDGNVYQPSNFNDYYAYEPITLAQAIALSDNVYAVRTNMYIGTNTLIDTAKQFGIHSDLPNVPSLALGTGAVTMKEMITGYGMLANGGKQINSYTIEKIVDREGNTIYERDHSNNKLVLDPKKAFILTQLLTGTFDQELNGYTAVTGSSISDHLTRTYAGKTGSTNPDSWMIGYSPNLVAGVWTGYDDNRSIDNPQERAYSKKVWAGFMEEVHKEMPEEHFDAPAGLVAVPVDPETGLRATPYCDASTVMFFEKGTEPENHCLEHFHEGDDGLGEEEVEESDDKGVFEKWFEVFFD